MMGSKLGNTGSLSQHSDLCSTDKVDKNYESCVAMPAEEVVVISRRQKCFDCCKKFIAFLFSTIGLTSMLIGYTIFGAFIFTKLEAPHEIRQKSQIKESRKWHIEKLWNVTLELNVFFEPNWTIEAETIFENFTLKVYEATKKSGWDGTDGTADIQWSFAGAMLYSITVITTIGYGHIAPRTTWGRIVTIFYAVIGIPLCLLTLTNLGGFMATAFRYIYNNICCGLCCLCCERPKKDGYVTSVANNAESASADGLSIPSPTSPDPLGSPNGRGRSPNKKVSMQVTWRSGISRVLKTEDNKTLSVPIYVSFLLIAGYIMCGAMLFTLWEDDWDYLVGSYFVFITLSTIGFGDFVPGTSTDSWNSQEKLVLCCMYLIFGLALIAMCFDLMQEEARNKVRKLGRKLGLIQKESTENEVNPEDSHKAVQTTSTAVKKSKKDKSNKDKPSKEKSQKKEKPAKEKKASKEKQSKDKSKREKTPKNPASSKSKDFKISRPLFRRAKSKQTAVENADDGTWPAPELMAPRVVDV